MLLSEMDWEEESCLGVQCDLNYCFFLNYSPATRLRLVLGPQSFVCLALYWFVSPFATL